MINESKGVLTFQGLGVEGWIGNQLFQLATTISTAIDNNMDYILPYWNYSYYFKNSFPQKERSYIEKIDKEIINETNFHYDEIIISDNKKNYTLTGYFQSWKYFNKNKDLILSFLEPKNEIINKIKSDWGHYLEKKTCAIHFRGGDYRNSPMYHPLCDMNYYTKAMKYMPSDTQYLVFSDEIDTIKNMFQGSQFLHVDYCDKTRGGDVILEFLLMSLCDNIITSNSTFSLWAAFLNKNDKKIIISPSKWFGPALQGYNFKDFYIPNSIII